MDSGATTRTGREQELWSSRGEIRFSCILRRRLYPCRGLGGKYPKRRSSKVDNESATECRSARANAGERLWSRLQCPGDDSRCGENRSSIRRCHSTNYLLSMTARPTALRRLPGFERLGLKQSGTESCQSASNDRIAAVFGELREATNCVGSAGTVCPCNEQEVWASRLFAANRIFLGRQNCIHIGNEEAGPRVATATFDYRNAR
jgi:hypothetical protein